MQITHLSKTINLFITGAFCVIAVIILDSGNGYKWLNFIFDSFPKDEATTVQVFLGFISISALIFIGVIFEGFTDIFESKMKKWFLEKFNMHRKFSWFLVQQKEFDSYEYWKRKCYELLQLSEPFRDQVFPSRLKDVAVTYFFANSSNQIIDWVVKHYVSHMLASNFIVVVFLSMVSYSISIIFTEFSWSLIIINGISLLMMYLTSVYSLTKYLYAYTIMYKDVSLQLLQNDSTKVAL